MALEPSDQKTVDDVAEFGWSSFHIFDNDPIFSFSVGFWESLVAPEVIVFGLERDLMHNMLWGMFDQIKAGKRLVDGERWSDLIEGFDCISRPVHPTQMRAYLGTALWYHRYKSGSSELSAFQLFWPGKLDGLYPWEPGSHADVREYQPLLYLPRA